MGGAEVVATYVGHSVGAQASLAQVRNPESAHADGLSAKGAVALAAPTRRSRELVSRGFLSGRYRAATIMPTRGTFIHVS
jgi:hypothetical protein